MSKRLDVLAAVKVLIATALPNATVQGLTADDAKPSRISVGGYVGIGQGDPGPAEIDLSPLTYNFDHAIPVMVLGYETATRSMAEAVDDMLVAIGNAIAADRTLGGLCVWIDAEAPGVADVTTDGTPVAAGADLTIIATYATANPLT